MPQLESELDNSRRTGAAIEAHYQFLVWLMPTVGKFPRSQKFTVGERIEAIALNVLEALIEATYTKERNQHLRAASARRMGGAKEHPRREALWCA